MSKEERVKELMSELEQYDYILSTIFGEKKVSLIIQENTADEPYWECITIDCEDDIEDAILWLQRELELSEMEQIFYIEAIEAVIILV
jgi:hypothetical protein